MPKDYYTGFDSGFASDADYEDGFVASDATIAETARRNGISHDQARGRLGLMDRLRGINARSDAENDGPETDHEYGT